MADIFVMRQIGPTMGLSVAATSHAGVTLTTYSNDQFNYCACMNTGSVAVAINFTGVNSGQTANAAVLPGDGTAGNFVLPPNMDYPLLIAVPATPPNGTLQVTAIGASAGPTLVVVTPVGNQ